MDKIIHAILLLVLGCLFGYGIADYFPNIGQTGGLMCFVAAAFRSVQVVADGVAELEYAELVGDPIE